MVFHRFLSGEARRRRIKIRLNGNPVASWDPFCRGEKRLRKLEGRSIPIEHNDVAGEVLFEPFVLPHQSRFSSPDAHEKAAGPRKWNRQQGFYIYRADRLIQSGGWSGLRVLPACCECGSLVFEEDARQLRQDCGELAVVTR